jgi:hypothetical protein
VEYKIKFAQPCTPKYGFLNKGTVTVDDETVRVSGTQVREYFFWIAIFLFPLAITINRIIGMWLGMNLKLIPLALICAAIILYLYYRWKALFDPSVSVEKRSITNLRREGETVSFYIPGPEGASVTSVKVALKAKNEDEAVNLENELQS